MRVRVFRELVKGSTMKKWTQMTRITRWLALAAIVGGCSTLPPLGRPAFDPAAVEWATMPGTNTLLGNARMREPGGELRTCAGATVALVPDSAYTRERMKALYGSVTRGMNDMSHGAARTVEDAAPLFVKAARLSTCDIRGGFRFSGLADGIWYVTTSIIWRTHGNDPASQTGAALMQQIVLQGGQTVSVLLSPQNGD